MINTELTLRPAVTEMTLNDGSVTELVMSSVVDNLPYYAAAFADAKTYTDEQDVVTLNAAEAFATSADEVVQAQVIQRSNHTGTQSVSTITGLAAVATSGLKSDVGLGNVDNLAPIDMPVSTAQATADTNTLNSAKSYSDSGDTTTLNSAKSYADSLVVGLFDFRGDYNASGNTYPTSSNNGSGSAGAVLKADVWRIGTQGTLQGKTARVGDLLTSVIDSPGQIDANWALTANELAYIPENTANKATDLSSNDNTYYPTTAAVQTAINTREPSITASVVTSFWSGTKTFRDLATDVRVVVLTGLSTATGTAITAADSVLSALGKLQNQASANATAITGKEPTITATTSADYYRGDKTFVSFATTVRATVLTGLSTATATVVTATDTVVSAIGKLQAQLSINSANAADFLVSRWHFNDWDNNSGGGGFTALAISSGTFTYNAQIAGMYGAVRISSSASVNSGGALLCNQAVLPTVGLIAREIFLLESAQATRQMRIGFCKSGLFSATEVDGVYAEVNDQTAVAWVVKGFAATSQGSTTLPLNTILICDVEILSATTSRIVIFEQATLTKWLDQTITADIPVNFVARMFKATSSSGGTLPLVVSDYSGVGLGRPASIQTP